MKNKYSFLIISLLFLMVSPIVYTFYTVPSSSLLIEAAARSTSHGIDITSVKRIYWMQVNKPFELAKELSQSTFPNTKEESGFLLLIEGNAVVAPGYATIDKSTEPYYIAEILIDNANNTTMAMKSVDFKTISKYGKLNKLGNPWATLLLRIIKR